MQNQHTEREYLDRIIELGVDPENARVRERLDGFIDTAYEKAGKEHKRRQERGAVQDRQAANEISSGLNQLVRRYVRWVMVQGLTFAAIALPVLEIAYMSMGIAHGRGVWAYSAAIASSAVIVVTYFALLFVREVISHYYSPDRESVGTVRDTVAAINYRLNPWSKQDRRYHGEGEKLLQTAGRTVNALMVAVVVFSLLGRLSPVLSETDGMNVADGMSYTLQNISLLELGETIGHTIGLIALLVATHFFVYFIHARFVAVTGGFDLSRFERPQTENELAEEYYLSSLHNYVARYEQRRAEQERERREELEQERQERPKAPAAPALNGNGRH